MRVVLFFLTVAGAGWGIWWKIDGKLAAARTEAATAAASASALAALAREELALHKLHTAEHYVSKAGLRETTDQIMEAISGVKAAVDNMTLRVDRIVEGQGRRTTTRG
ncbi:MAG: hypothetical protein AAAB20_01475 [Rhizobium sp.]|uniref:hypothetical protein n=1 Tax=Rhizobium sp. TaxID=391 RepID=UPI000A779492